MDQECDFSQNGPGRYISQKLPRVSFKRKKKWCSQYPWNADKSDNVILEKHTVRLTILIMICTISESLGSQGHLHITRTTDNVIYGLDTCTVCQNYTQSQTYSLRACSVAHLRHDIHKLKRALSEALRTYEQMINMGIEEEERNGMFTNYKHQTVFNGNPVSLMQKYAAMHSMLHKISLNITVTELLVDQTLMTSFQQVLMGVICHLQTVLELESFRDDRHAQVTCRRSLTLSRDIEYPLSENSRINFTIYSLLTARDALNKINNAMDALFISLRL